MITLASVIERFAQPYLARYGDSVLPSQRQALTAMAACRSRLSTRMLAQCGQCGDQRLVPHSCGHRFCPHCQLFESQRWIARQTKALVPAPYFLITFTVPAELRALLWQHQRVLYAALMDCAWGTLQTFGHHRPRCTLLREPLSLPPPHVHELHGMGVLDRRLARRFTEAQRRRRAAVHLRTVFPVQGHEGHRERRRR